MKPRDDAEVADWLEKASRDRAAAGLLHTVGLHDLACFHCQQAAEKALKALLIAVGQVPARTHDLQALVVQLTQAAAPLAGIDEAAAYLKGFAVISRYPGFGSVDEATATRAVGAADQIQEAVRAAFAMG